LSPPGVRRTSEIEEPSNLYLIHPVAARLVTVFAATGVTPNMVSLTGMGCGIAAGFAYFHVQDTRFVVAGFLLMLSWHVLDGADGQLARLTRNFSEFGRTLDGICDYVTFIAVYVGLALGLGGGPAWPLILTAGLCHAVQSAAYEAQRQAYGVWGEGRPEPGPLAGSVGRVYAWVQALLRPVPLDVERRLSALRGIPDFQARYRAVFAPSIRRWSVLSANYRTFGIFVCTLAGAPRFYFWFEILGFSAILAILLLLQRARYRRFVRLLSDEAAGTATPKAP
jgi:phosphatidylglycerophosphate synthase